MTRPTPETHPSALAAWRERIGTLARAILAPRARVRGSEWVEANLWLPPDNTSQAGPLRYDNAPYLREIIDWLTDPTHPADEGVVAKSAQLGFTVGVFVAGLCYYVAQDPAPILVMQPTLDDAERFSKKKLMPIVRASPALRARIAEARPGDASNTILQKSGPGWSASIVGAKSPRQMRSDSIRIYLSDERSAYDRSAGVEGNPYLLGRKRTDSFDNRKILTGSTPLLDPDEIEAAYRDSDQRKFYVPCPHCGHEQPLTWENFRWEKEGEGETKRHLPETAHFVCIANGCVIEERHKRWMVTRGRFVAENPGHRKPGWFIWQAYSLFPKARWGIIAQEWLDAQGDDERLKIVYNTVRGQSFKERAERVDASDLEARREVYRAPVPMRAGLLTASVDVQSGSAENPGRLEFLVKGWGAGEESWQIAHYRIYGDVKEPTVWNTLDRLRRMPWRHESGVDLYIQCCAIDSGDETDLVYDYVRPRQREGVIAVKGVDDRGKPMIIRAGKAKAKGVKLWLVGTHTAKVRLFSRLRLAPPAPGEPPRPGAIHFPLAQEDGLDAAYLAQFGNNKMVPKKLPNGRIVNIFKKVGPDEAVDLDCYALIALHALGDTVRANLAQYAAQLALRAGTPGVVTPASAPGGPTPGAPPSIEDVAGAQAAPAPPPRARGRRVRSRGIAA